MMKNFLLTVTLCILLCQNVKAANCPPMYTSPDVKLWCIHPETGLSMPCNTEMPPYTEAYYECSKFYTRPIGESDSGRMTCQINGNWGRLSFFEDFKCKLETPALLNMSPVIVNGEVTTRENFPWYAAIFRSEGPGTPYRFFCGGTLINPANKGFLVLTASHCVVSSPRTTRVRPLDDFKIVLGPVSTEFNANQITPGVQILGVKAAKVNPNYNYDTVQNDIAIMKMDGKVEVSEYVSPACFPTQDMFNMLVTGTGMIAGFGVDNTTYISSHLNFVALPVQDNSICNVALSKQLSMTEFCAGHLRGKSICSGDSGGGLIFRDPLTKKFYIQGIASNVDRRPLDTLRYCQNYNTFTRVSSYVDWVEGELDGFFGDDMDEVNPLQQSWNNRPNGPTQQTSGNDEFLITQYDDYENNRETYVEWRMRNCSAVPKEWNGRRFWIDIHGKCIMFYEGTYCYGKSLKLQSTPNSSLFQWNFPQFNIKSASLCPGSDTTISSTTPGPSGIDNVQGVNAGGGKDYKTIGIERHNLYRTKHGVSPLRLNENLNLAATSYAYELLTKTNLQPSGKGGENLFEIIGSVEPYESVIVRAVDLWYSTMKDYKWRNPSATSFSQLVWKSTKELGIGIARSGRRTVVVARYSPAGNIYFVGNGDRTKFFRENVFPPRK